MASHFRDPSGQGHLFEKSLENEGDFRKNTLTFSPKSIIDNK